LNPMVILLVHSGGGRRRCGAFFFLTADALIICFSLFLAFFVHFEFSPNIRYLSLLVELALAFVALKIALLAAFRVYSITWRYVGINDLVSIFLAMLIAELLLVVLSTPSSLLPISGLRGSRSVSFSWTGSSPSGLSRRSGCRGGSTWRCSGRRPRFAGARTR